MECIKVKDMAWGHFYLLFHTSFSTTSTSLIHAPSTSLLPSLQSLGTINGAMA